jgi:ubiquitin carboxyl-terminal hydrolase 4/11/15
MSKITAISNKGLTGLRNLGNTCYLNSGVQCLSNTFLLSKFFLEDLYNEDINENNPLGTKGILARSYAKLVKMLWSTSDANISLGFFKKAIGEFRPVFSNHFQHDAQELLSAVLDGLHEDLNRVKNKPYVEMKNTDDPNNDAISIDSWYCHLARNQSIIVDLMYGQYKSILKCPRCNKYSITFDPFSMVTLPISSNKYKIIKFYYVPFNTGRKIQRHALIVQKDSTIEDMRVLLANRLGIHKDGSTFTMVSKWDKSFDCFLNRDKKVSEIEKNMNTKLYIQEINPKYFNGLEDQRFRKEKNKEMDLVGSEQEYEEQKLEVKDHDDNNNGLSHDMLRVSLNVFKFLWSCNNYINSDEQRQTFNRLIYIRRSHTMKQVHMEIFKYFRPFIEKSLKQSMRQEKFDINNEENKNKNFKSSVFNEVDYKEEVKKDYSLVTDEELFEMMFPDLNESNWEDASIKDYPYVIKLIRTLDRYYEKWCFYCKRKECNNCLVPFTNNLTVQDLLNRTKDPDTKNDYYYQTHRLNLNQCKDFGFEVLFRDDNRINMKYLGEVEETKDYTSLLKNQNITIYNCFEQFSAWEKLSENDLWYCSTCREHVQASKRIEIFRAPPILILHLKRFKIKKSIFSQQTSERIDTLVDYPLENLDLSGFVREKSVEPIYDLYAVSNHIGNSGFGHYTAYARNNNSWLRFDDSDVTKMSPLEVCSSAGYVLFYKRKDLRDDIDLQKLRQTVPNEYKVNIIELKMKDNEEVKADGVSSNNSVKEKEPSTVSKEEVNREIEMKEFHDERRKYKEVNVEQQYEKRYAVNFNKKNQRE